MIGYTKEELSKARLDLEDIPIDMDILVVYPGLASLDHWNYDFSSWSDKPIVTRNMVIRYLNYFYSKELICIKERYPDFIKRKAECAILAKFNYDPENLQFSPRVKEMLEGRNAVVNRMMVAFLRHNYDVEYATYAYSLELLYNKMTDGAAALGDGQLKEAPTSKDADEFARFSERLEGMRLKLLNGDRHPEISAALLISIEEDRLNLGPEHRAKLTREGKSPLKDFDFYAPNNKNS